MAKYCNLHIMYCAGVSVQGNDRNAFVYENSTV